MIDPQVARTISNSKLGLAIAKQLWPTMLFLVVMSAIVGLGSYWWTTSIGEPISRLISFWIWYIATLVITAYGIYAFFIDIRIQSAKLLSGE